MPEWAQSLALAAIAGGLIKTIGDGLLAWWNRRKTDADARKSEAEADVARAEAARTIVDAAHVSNGDLQHLITELKARIDELAELRGVDQAKAAALAEEVDQLKRQQGVNMATIAALNAQNASTLKMNNDLLLENRLLHQRIGQLETELNTERQANIVMQQKVRGLEARIAELEARSPA